MNTDAFRDLYNYHFTINRKIWDKCIVPLTDEQFKQARVFSVGSIHNQIVHLLNVDERWFCGLRRENDPGLLNPDHLAKRTAIREKWDGIEAQMRAYLHSLKDEQLSDQPFLPVDGDPIRVWQVLLHVVNHGTDHRAQVLASLNQLGIETFSQDYSLFIDGRM